LICDYSYRKDVLLDMITKTKKLLVIDHHKSAQKDLEGVEDQFKIFDMNHSGAVLVWKYFYPDDDVPLFVSYVEDRDIWKKALPGTDDFFAALCVLPHEFEIYNKCLESEEVVKDMINNTGKKYGELNSYIAQQSTTYARPKFARIKNKYYFIAYVNNSTLKSDIGNLLFSKLPLIDFSAVYNINDSDDTTSFSLRSTTKHADVSKIAFKFGGGGHACASGVKVEALVCTLPGKTYDHGEVYSFLENVYFHSLEINAESHPILNILYLHTNIYKYQLGSYFLQKKYKVKENDVKKRVQVGSCIKEGSNQYLHLSALWSYNPVADTSDYVITFDKFIDDESRKKIFSILSSYGIHSSIETSGDPINNFRMSLNGLVKQLAI